MDKDGQGCVKGFLCLKETQKGQEQPCPEGEAEANYHSNKVSVFGFCS